MKFKAPNSYDDLSFLTHLYVKKRYSLRRISRKLGCSKTTVRKKLREAGIEVLDSKLESHGALKRKVERLRKRGLSYQRIADLFNLWRIDTRSGGGKWHAESVRNV